MTLFGKILIGLMLALSLVFASLSAAVYSAQFNYRTALEDAQKRLTVEAQKAKDLEDQLRQDISDVEAAAAVQKDELDRQTLKVSQYEDQIGLLQQDLDSTRTALDVQTALVEIAQDESQDRRVEVLSGRERTASLAEKYVAAEAEIASLVDDNFSQSVTITQMDSTNKRLIDENAALRQQLIALGVEPNTDQDVDIPAPDVTGKVLLVKDLGSAGTKVAISLGSDDGLRVGDELEVVRTAGGGKYVGRIRLTEVEYDLSIGNLVFKSPTATVQKDDDVKTRL